MQLPSWSPNLQLGPRSTSAPAKRPLASTLLASARQDTITLAENKAIYGRRNGHIESNPELPSGKHTATTDDYLGGDSHWVRLKTNTLQLWLPGGLLFGPHSEAGVLLTVSPQQVAGVAEMVLVAVGTLPVRPRHTLHVAPRADNVSEL